MLDQRIAGRVAQGFVDGLKSGQVHQRQAIGFGCAGLLRLEQRRAVGQTGQRVVEGQVFDVAFALRHGLGHGVQGLAYAVYLLGAGSGHAAAVVAIGNALGRHFELSQRAHHAAGGAYPQPRGQPHSQQRQARHPQRRAVAK